MGGYKAYRLTESNSNAYITGDTATELAKLTEQNRKLTEQIKSLTEALDNAVTLLRKANPRLARQCEQEWKESKIRREANGKAEDESDCPDVPFT